MRNNTHELETILKDKVELLKHYDELADQCNEVGDAEGYDHWFCMGYDLAKEIETIKSQIES